MMIHERLQSVPMTDKPSSFSRKNNSSGGRKRSKSKSPAVVAIPPRCALPDGSSVDFGHGGTPQAGADADAGAAETGKKGGRKTRHSRRTSRGNKRNSGNNGVTLKSTADDLKGKHSGVLLKSTADELKGKRSGVVLKSTADGMKATTQGLKNLLISGAPAEEPSLPDGSRPDFGQSSSQFNHSRNQSNQSYGSNGSRSSSGGRSPPLSSASSMTILRSPISMSHFDSTKIPDVQVLPDGSRPDFGTSPSASSSSSSRASTRKTSNSNSISVSSRSTDSLDSNMVYAGSSFTGSPSANSLPKPSFSRR